MPGGHRARRRRIPSRSPSASAAASGSRVIEMRAAAPGGPAARHRGLRCRALQVDHRGGVLEYAVATGRVSCQQAGHRTVGVPLGTMHASGIARRARKAGSERLSVNVTCPPIGLHPTQMRGDPAAKASEPSRSPEERGARRARRRIQQALERRAHVERRQLPPVREFQAAKSNCTRNVRLLRETIGQIAGQSGHEHRSRQALRIGVAHEGRAERVRDRPRLARIGERRIEQRQRLGGDCAHRAGRHRGRADRARHGGRAVIAPAETAAAGGDHRKRAQRQGEPEAPRSADAQARPASLSGIGHARSLNDVA